MNNIEFDAYLTKVFRLTRSIVIKIEAVAIHDNEMLRQSGYPVSSDKRTWRYYLNMNGDYHPTDEIMYVKSVDTDEIIEFNKKNMEIHLGTFREYSLGGDLFQRLNTQYDAQSELIKGILDPIPFDETIEAEDYKILKYNKSLVLWNEDQLIPKLQDWVNTEIRHTFENDYRITDNMMLPIGIVKLYGDIIKAICVIRVEAIGTRYVHDFYIWSHIDSYGDFSKYKNSLTRFQVMWLYRNIASIKNNPGQQYTFNKLMDNLLTHAGIPLAKYDMVETTETQLEDLTPTPLYRKLQLNLQDEYGRAASFIDTAALILKQRDLAKENFEQSGMDLKESLQLGKFSLHSELPTKVLESTMSDYTNRHIETLMSTVYSEWIYLSGKGVYNAKVMAVDPKTGKSFRLAGGDAYYIWKYLIAISVEQIPVVIEKAYYQNVMRLKPPTVPELIDIGGRAFINDRIAKGILEQWVQVSPFIVPERLMDYSFQVYGSIWNLRKQYSTYYDLNMRARVQNTTRLMFESGFTTLTTFKTYQELLTAYELDFSEYTAEEARNFAWDIFSRVTGWNSNIHPSLRAKQSDLLEIMSRLSSYTIQIIKEMDDGVDLVEVKNETFIGDPRWTGQGNELDGDFTSAVLSNKGYIDSILYEEALTRVYEQEKLTSKMGSETKALIISHDHIKPVNLSDDLRTYAVRIQDVSYFRPLVLEDIPAPITNLDGTDYDELDLPTIAEDQIQTTDYGALKPSADAVHIGRLSFPVPKDTKE